ETEVVEPGEEASIHLNRITPVYPLTEGLPQRWLRALISRTLEKYEPHIPELWPELSGAVADSISPVAPLTRAQAIRLIHFPEVPGDAERARRRLALDEFIEIQRHIQVRRKNLIAKATAIACSGDNH